MLLTNKLFFKQIQASFKTSLSYLLIFQLIISPYLAGATQVVKNYENKAYKQEQKQIIFNSNKEVKSLNKLIFSSKKDKRKQKYYKNHSLDVFSLLGQSFETRSAYDKIHFKNIFIRIVTDDDERSVKSILTHKDNKSLAKQALNSNQKLFSGFKFQNTELDSKKTFQIVFQNQVIHSFPQQLHWFVFFDNYLLFLEPSKVSDKKALLSFIDLKYFQQALGQTALPIFHIPVHFKVKGQKFLSRSDLEFPTSININKSQLSLGKLPLSLDQMDFLSALQQLNWNTSVAFADPENINATPEFLQELVDSYQQPLFDNYDQNSKTSVQDTQISKNTKKMVDLILKRSGALGSRESNFGQAGKLNKIKDLLSTKDLLKTQEKNLSISEKRFLKDIQISEQFQRMLNQVHQNMSKKDKLFRRISLFLSYIAFPQPLGAPKILKALGNIAGSVSVKDNPKPFLRLKEGSKQMMTIHKNTLTNHPFISTSVLLGIAATSFSGLPQYFLQAANSAKTWMNHFTELGSLTIHKSFAWIGLESAYDNLIAGSNLMNLSIGLSAMFFILSAFLGSTHAIIQLQQFSKYKKNHKQDSHVKETSGQMFIQYIEDQRFSFLENLAKDVKQRVGQSLEIQIGQETHKILLKSASRLEEIYSLLDSNQELFLEIKSLDPKNQTTKIILDLHSTNQDIAKSTDAKQLSIIVPMKQQKAIKTFTVLFGSVQNFLNILSQRKTLILDISSKTHDYITGLAFNADFSQEEEDRLKNIFKEIGLESKSRQKALTKLSNQKVTKLSQAIRHMFFDESSWTGTFRAFGLGWNWWFLIRSFWTKPRLLFSVLYYSKYYQSFYNENEPSVFNGGKQNRISHMLTAAKTGSKFKIKDSLKALKSFETEIEKIEKQVLKEVTAQSYLAVLKASDENVKDKNIILTQYGKKNFNINNLKQKSLKIFYSTYQQSLFSEVMKAYLNSHLNSTIQTNDSLKLKETWLKQQMQDGPIAFKSISQQEIKNIITQVLKRKNIYEQAKKAHKNFITSFNAVTQYSNKNSLDPNKSIVTKRIEISKKGLNNPESLARNTRAQIARLMVDKPVELVYSLLIFSGMEGMLQVVHPETFSEQSFFHLSRFVIWFGFFSNLFLEILVGPWFKAQLDDRIGSTEEGFTSIPKKEDVTKRFAKLKWMKKQFNAPENSLWKNYKYLLEISIANMPAAFITYVLLFFASIGRFDLEIFLAVYVAIVFMPFDALNAKLENTYELSANYDFKNLIKKDLDLAKKDKHFLYHHKVQSYFIKESAKSRKSFNLFLALLYNNFMENISHVFFNLETSLGSRAYSRLFFGQTLLTEHWVNFMDYLEQRQLLSPQFSETCKKIFTNNREDF